VCFASAGYFSNSLALMSDAGHNFADALALALAAYGLWIAGKPADAEHEGDRDCRPQLAAGHRDRVSMTCHC
jgi:hypothetical protein